MRLPFVSFSSSVIDIRSLHKTRFPFSLPFCPIFHYSFDRNF